jgi:restriction system protein
MIPDFQSLMLPVLKFVRDNKEHSIHDVIDFLAKEFKLTEEELNEWLPSKTQKIFYNRVYWAKAYLKMAGLVENVKRSYFKITPQGQQVLSENLENINIRYLRKFPEFISSIDTSKKTELKEEETSSHASPSSKTPQEVLEDSYQKINESLSNEVLSRVKKIHPSNFENLVVELLVKMGYGGTVDDAAKTTKYRGDEGIDGIIKEDKLGLDVIYIQAKRWENVIGRPEVQKFVGALAGQRAKKGVFITTSHFTREAIDYAAQMDTKIVLIDGEKLSQLMIDYNLGVSVQNTYEIKKIDSDYFEEE